MVDGKHAKRFTGVPRQLLDRERVYMLAWVGTRWEVVAESAPLVDGLPGGAPDAPPHPTQSGGGALGVSWDPVTPEQIRDRHPRSAWSTSDAGDTG